MKLVENIVFDSACEFIEAEGARTIKNVLMLGPESSHGYGYRGHAVKTAVDKGLYEGVRIFINHATGGRDLMHLAGVFRESRYEDGKAKGNAHLLDDDYGRKFWNIAKDMPEAAGCSHVADGKLVRGDDGKNYVEEITRVYSVDLVVQGATTKNVFEGEGDPPVDEPRMAAVPRPAEREKQYEFIPRCIKEVQSNNATITDEEAGAICFMAWSSRYEADGMGPGTLSIPIPSIEDVDLGADINEDEIEINTVGHRPRKDTTVKSISEQFEQLEVARREASEVLTVDETRDHIVRTYVQEQDEKERAERLRSRPTQRQISEASQALDGGREPDGAFNERMREEDKRRNPQQYASASQLKEINASLTLTPNLIG